jgi:hypothetical protein
MITAVIHYFTRHCEIVIFEFNHSSSSTSSNIAIDNDSSLIGYHDIYFNSFTYISSQNKLVR